MHIPHDAGDPSLLLLTRPDRETDWPNETTGTDDRPTVRPTLPPATLITSTTPDAIHRPSSTAEPALPLPVVPGYEILNVLGSGSMGIVYKARQIALGRLVALKMILAGGSAGQATLQRFITEARVVASLQHPNIVAIYEINLDHASPYFSMELVEGDTLADRLGGRPQSMRDSAQLVGTLARTIHVAHQNGIVHRDLKPANILLARLQIADRLLQIAEEGSLASSPSVICNLQSAIPKITDFGLAKELNSTTGQTESGIIMGTPSYMAPEQAEGKSNAVGPAADIYALGAILYEMLTGRPPFTAESHMETLLLLFHAEPVSPSRLQPKVPRDLETICLKCLNKNPTRRYNSAEELADDLHRFLIGEPIWARPASLPEQLSKWLRRRPALAMLAGCALLAVFSLLGLILWHQVDLQSQLGQALQEERETRAVQEAADERERLGQVRDRAKDLLHTGEQALAARDWHKARVQLARARDQVAGEPDLAEMQAHIEKLLRQSDQQHLDHQRLQKFLQHRNEALFHATRFTGGNLESALKETRTAAREALGLFGGKTGDPCLRGGLTGKTGDPCLRGGLTGKTGDPCLRGGLVSAPCLRGRLTGAAVDNRVVLDSPWYTRQQKDEIVTGCYELLVVLADAEATPLPGSSADDQCRQAEEALRILDQTAGLGVSTQAYHRRRAHYLAQAGQSEAAAEERRRAGALRPSTPLDYFLLGQEEYHRGESNQAIRALQGVLQLQPDHFWASYYLGLCWLKTHRPDQAVACLTSCLSQRRDFPWPYLLRAAAWGELSQFARAEADFEAALQAKLPESARYGLLVNRGVLRIRQGRLDSARADLCQAIALRPGQYPGYLNLAQAHLKERYYDRALTQLGQAIHLEPGLASLYRTRAHVHLLRHDTAAALADFDRAIQKDVSLPIVADDHLECGRLLCLRKDFPGALKACDIVLRIRPRDARASRLRAEALLELQHLPEALQSLDDCLKHGPADADVFRARAALRTRLGQYASAQTDYTRALELQPSAATYADRGWCYLVADAPKLALPDFEEAIRRAPEQGDAYAGRGYCRALCGEERVAVRDAEEALRRGPQTSRLYYNIARIYAQASRRLHAGGTDSPSTRRANDMLRSDWRMRALETLSRALELRPAPEAAHFWQNVIDPDKALDPLRSSQGFRKLAARYSPPVRQGSPPPGGGSSTPRVLHPEL